MEKAINPFTGETVKRVMRDKTYPLFHSIKYIGWVDGWKERKQDGWTDTENEQVDGRDMGTVGQTQTEG